MQAVSDKLLYHTEYLDLMQRDGWYYFAKVPGSAGGIAILLYRQGCRESILGRYEVCPVHGDGLALTTVAGGIEEGDTPPQTAIKESYEEAGYRLNPDQLISLGQCNLSTNQDTVVYLFAADVSGLIREEAPGDGTKGEEGAYCGWVQPSEAVLSKSAFMSVLILRLFILRGINLLSKA